jgi:hypothetical protein
MATEATVFGLDVRADTDLSFLQHGGTRPTGRRLDVTVAPAEADEWSPDADLICDQRNRDGSINFQIESDPGAGYRIWGPEYGASVLSRDGRRISSEPGEGRQEWERMLVAQVLPFASVLRGLEVLHASAVVVEGAAVALAGPSGAGKTSLAMALNRDGGGGFLADDVLAVERVGEDLLVHPGAPIAAIDHREAERLRVLELAVGRERVLGSNSREEITRIDLAEPAPLGSLFFIARDPDGPGEPRFESVSDPRLLLSATFNLILASPQRLQRLLETAALASRGRVERVSVGPDVDATALAAAIRRRIGAA